MSDVRKILVTGASGYVGGRLVTSLLEDNAQVRVFVRDANKAQSHSWASKVEIAVGNASDYQSTVKALTGIHTAFYLLHSINSGTNFDKIESDMARSFAKAAQEANVKQIIYLGGINNDAKTSKHLKSRANTGKELATTDVAVLELRAGIIIGSGSASFEMLRHLTHRLPIMTTPKWVMNRTHPIAIRDVLWYLKNAAKLEKPVSAVFDIGGPEVLKYSEMMNGYAVEAGMKERAILRLPVLTPYLASQWVNLVTPIPRALAVPIIASLQHDCVMNEHDVDEIIPPPAEGLLPYRTAVALAQGTMEQGDIENNRHKKSACCWNMGACAPMSARVAKPGRHFGRRPDYRRHHKKYARD